MYSHQITQLAWCPFPPETSFLSGHSLPHHLVSHSKHGSQQISCCTTTKPCTGTLHAGAWRYCGAGSQFSTQGVKRNQFSMDRDRSGCWVTAEARDTQPKQPAGINNAGMFVVLAVSINCTQGQVIWKTGLPSRKGGRFHCWGTETAHGAAGVWTCWSCTQLSRAGCLPMQRLLSCKFVIMVFQVHSDISCKILCSVLSFPLLELLPYNRVKDVCSHLSDMNLNAKEIRSNFLK